MLLRNRVSSRTSSSTDMTPMVDVTFLLLIFFMVTAAFQMRVSLPIPSPHADLPSQSPRDEQQVAITVIVDERSSFLVSTPDWEREAGGRVELIRHLKAARRQTPNAPPIVLVKAHGDALHDAVVTALDAARRCDVDEVQLMMSDG